MLREIYFYGISALASSLFIRAAILTIIPST